MPFCPNCGADVAQTDRFCVECGTPQETPPQSADRPRSDAGPPAGEEPSHQPPRPASTQPQPSHPPPRHHGAPGGEVGGLSRRRVLLGGGGVVGLLAVAGGWYFSQQSGGGPRAALDRSWDLWDAGDAQGYQALYHSASPDRDSSWWNDDEYWSETFPTESEGVEWEIVDRELVEQSESRAVFREVYTWEDPQMSGERLRIADSIEFRVENGEWKLWSWESESSEVV